MSWTEPSADGQLLLWQGPPGTGKTWGLRALASEWSQWAEFHYITDPDAFFVTNPSYMIDVLLSDSYMAIEQETGDVYDETDAGGKWRVLILEDTGELLSANAKEQYGQGLSRLLNVVDGMIGQGLRVLALVTTNDELRRGWANPRARAAPSPSFTHAPVAARKRSLTSLPPRTRTRRRARAQATTTAVARRTRARARAVTRRRRTWAR
jgi:primosomal protein N'